MVTKVVNLVSAGEKRVGERRAKERTRRRDSRRVTAYALSSAFGKQGGWDVFHCLIYFLKVFCKFVLSKE